MSKDMLDVCKTCFYWDGEDVGCGFDPGRSTTEPACHYKGTGIGLMTGTSVEEYLQWQISSGKKVDL